MSDPKTTQKTPNANPLKGAPSQGPNYVAPFIPSSLHPIPSGPVKPLPLQQTDGKITKKG